MPSASFWRLREIALADPLDAIAALRDRPGAFVLHSGLREPRGRWSFFGADPWQVFGPDRYDEAIALWRARRTAEPCLAGGTPLPFAGGLVGCWSYDFGRRIERLPAIAIDDVGWPDVWLAAYDVIGAFDHASGRAWLVASGLPAEAEARPRRAQERLDQFARRLEVVRPRERGARSHRRAPAALAARSTFTPDGYRRAVEQVREHIRRGDIFQANLSQRWAVPIEPAPGSPAGVARRLFAALAAESAAPFSAWLDLGGFAIASASPERFLELKDGRVETRPIKGTRPRGAGAAEDAAQARALLASAKDRAENVMIVDVLRNDLGRVCETGSVAVPELCALEAFPQVFHLTSTVTGTLCADRDAADLLHACFPGGSITGAPKIRAMEILESLEPVRRHLYTGAIGWLDWRGDADWSIAIRTAMVTPSALYFAAGGGITADSDPDAEYRESLAKAEGMSRALAATGRPVRLAPEGHAIPAPAGRR